MDRGPSRSGIVLILICSIMVIMILFGLTIGKAATLSTADSIRRLSLSRARFAAKSGMEYAVARIAQQSLPDWNETLLSRGDDWNRRDPMSLPLEESLNPSYSHGEPWVATPIADDGVDNDGDGLTDEPDEGKGRFSAVQIAAHDLDGDTRFSAWTGRLRGGFKRYAIRFSLEIRPTGSKLPVNAGYLDAEDRNGNGQPDHCDFLSGNPGADIQVSPYHRGLEHVFNNLGALILPSASGGTGTRVETIPAGDSGNPVNWIQLSRLGNDLLRSRPEGGYRTLNDVKLKLMELGYSEDEADAVVLYLDVGPYDPIGELSRGSEADGNDPPPYVPVNLLGASREVLESLLRYNHVGAGQWSMVRIPGEAAAWNNLSSRTASTEFNWLNAMIYPDEALAIAQEIIRWREEGGPSWGGLYQRLCAKAPVLFALDFSEIEAGVPPPCVAAWTWGQLKADVAFHSLAVDPFPYPKIDPWGWEPWLDGSISGLATWACWGVDRGLGPLAQLPTFVSLDKILRVSYPAGYPAFPAPAGDPWGSGDPTHPYWNSSIWTDGIRPQGGIIAPLEHLDVRSIGRELGKGTVETAEGTVRVGETLVFACQEDFEKLQGVGRIGARGISIDSRYGSIRFAETDDMGTPADPDDDRTYPHVISLPRPNWRAYVPDPAAYGFSRTYGALALSPLQSGMRGADFYWPFKEDADNVMNNGFQAWPVFGPPTTWTNGPSGDFWHEVDAASPPVYPHPPCPALYDDWFLTNDIDSHKQMPTQYTGRLMGTAATPFQMPGLHGDPGTYNAKNRLEQLTIEAWASTCNDTGNPGSLELFGNWPTYPPVPPSATPPPAPGWVWVFRLMITRNNFYNADERGTTYYMILAWSDTGDFFRALQWSPFWFIPDDPAGGPTQVGHHIAVTFQRDGTGGTAVRLFVDGKDHPDPAVGPMVFRYYREPHPEWSPPYGGHGEMMVTGSETFKLENMDDLRLYPRALDPGIGTYGAPNAGWPASAEVKERYELGRFVRAGTYLSPLYVFDEPGEFGQVNWTGIVPAAYPPGSLQLRLYGYADADGTVPALSPNPWTSPGRDAWASPRQIAKVRSFRWEAAFNCLAVDTKDMMDTPVFESMALSFRRPRRAPVWRAWRD